MDEFCAEMGEWVRAQLAQWQVQERARVAREREQAAWGVVQALEEMGVRVEEGTGRRVVAVVHISKEAESGIH